MCFSLRVQLVATVELLALWILWALPYVFRAPKIQKRKSIAVFGPTTLGLMLEAAGVVIVWHFRVPGGIRTDLGALIAAPVVGAMAVLLMWTAIPNLGRQFRIYAGLYEDHELVRTGPYAVVRHPIYASVLALTLSTGILLTLWPWLIAALAVSVAGTEVRLRSEEKLLAARFGTQFSAYKSRVPAYLPFLR